MVPPPLPSIAQATAKLLLHAKKNKILLGTLRRGPHSHSALLFAAPVGIPPINEDGARENDSTPSHRHVPVRHGPHHGVPRHGLQFYVRLRGVP
jgi:hypothetical protein